jgi:DNA invertase Pin-like site-specific DNA recombinase
VKALTVIGYTRVSSVEQLSEGVSLDAQHARIVAWAEATDVNLLDVVQDGAVSGTKALDEREGGCRISRLLEQRRPEADAVVVTRLDRLGRNAAETLGHLRTFAAGRVGLVSITERLDLTTPAGRAMASMSAVFAELERDLIAQRTGEALGRLRDEGKVYGAVPYGWVRDGDRLLPDTDEQRVRHEILELRHSRCSFREIAGWLNGEGIPAKRGGEWSAMSVRSVCRAATRRDQLAVAA